MVLTSHVRKNTILKSSILCSGIRRMCKKNAIDGKLSSKKCCCLLLTWITKTLTITQNVRDITNQKRPTRHMSEWNHRCSSSSVAIKGPAPLHLDFLFAETHTCCLIHLLLNTCQLHSEPQTVTCFLQEFIRYWPGWEADSWGIYISHAPHWHGNVRVTSATCPTSRLSSSHFQVSMATLKLSLATYFNSILICVVLNHINRNPRVHNIKIWKYQW